MNKYLECILIFFSLIILTKLISKIFVKINKKKKIHLTFLKSILQTIIVFIGIFVIGSKFETFKQISSSIITGSTLIVAVLAFSLEEGIANIIHGLIISVCKPFNIGDRLTLPNQNITGTVENITIRHTVIKNCITGTSILIPNSIMNKEIIENSYYLDTIHTHYIDILISRDSDVDKAQEIFKQEIKNDKRYCGDDDLYIFVREISENSICLRAFIPTKTLEENFVACSEIRKNVLKRYKNENISEPYQKCKYI